MVRTSKYKVGIIVEGDTSGAEKELKGLDKLLGKFGEQAENAIGFAMGGALLKLPGMIMDAGRALGDFVMDAAELQTVKGTFDKLSASIGTTSDALLGKMKNATSGMIADSDLMQAANKFVAMGLTDTAEGAAEMAKVAVELGSAMGEDATGSMENFALMMANQSIPRLDSFGISSGKVRERIDELMESTEDMTREQAFNIAVMEEAAKTMAKVGDQSGGTKGSIDRIKATFTNLKDTLGQALIPAFENVLGVFSTMVSNHGPKLQEIIKEAGAQFSIWVKDVLPKVVAWFRDELVPTIRDKVIPAAKEIVAWIKDDAVPWIRDKLIPAIGDLIGWFKDIWENFQDVYAELSTTIDQIGVIFDNLWPYFLTVGADIVSNIKQGIEDAWAGFITWITGKAQEIINTLLGALGFGSPSKVFMGIGRGMMESMAMGIGDGLEMPITAAVTAGSMAAGATQAGMQQHDHWNMTINTQATSEDVAYSYDMMRAMAGA